MVPLTFSWHSICPIATIKTNCMDVLDTFNNDQCKLLGKSAQTADKGKY